MQVGAYFFSGMYTVLRMTQLCEQRRQRKSKEAVSVSKRACNSPRAVGEGKLQATRTSCVDSLSLAVAVTEKEERLCDLNLWECDPCEPFSTHSKAWFLALSRWVYLNDFQKTKSKSSGFRTLLFFLFLVVIQLSVALAFLSLMPMRTVQTEGTVEASSGPLIGYAFWLAAFEILTSAFCLFAVELPDLDSEPSRVEEEEEEASKRPRACEWRDADQKNEPPVTVTFPRGRERENNRRNEEGRESDGNEISPEFLDEACDRFLQDEMSQQAASFDLTTELRLQDEEGRHRTLFSCSSCIAEGSPDSPPPSRCTHTNTVRLSTGRLSSQRSVRFCRANETDIDKLSPEGKFNASSKKDEGDHRDRRASQCDPGPESTGRGTQNISRTPSAKRGAETVTPRVGISSTHSLQSSHRRHSSSAAHNDDLPAPVPARNWFYSSERRRVAILIPTHGLCGTPEGRSLLRETLLAAVNVAPPGNIIVCDNAISLQPPDNTWGLVEDLADEIGCDRRPGSLNGSFHYIYLPVANKTLGLYWPCKYWIPKLIRERRTGAGQEGSIDAAILIDDDCKLPERLDIAACISQLDEDPSLGAVAWSIHAAPPPNPTLMQRLIVAPQSIEYFQAGLARRTQALGGSVIGPHGAACLWRLDHLVSRVFPSHDTEFLGEDLQMGMRSALSCAWESLTVTPPCEGPLEEPQGAGRGDRPDETIQGPGGEDSSACRQFASRRVFWIDYSVRPCVHTPAPSDFLTLWKQRWLSWDLAAGHSFTALLFTVAVMMNRKWRLLAASVFLLIDCLTIAIDWARVPAVVFVAANDPSLLYVVGGGLILWDYLFLFLLWLKARGRGGKTAQVTFEGIVLFPFYRLIGIFLFRQSALVENFVRYVAVRKRGKKIREREAARAIPPRPSIPASQVDWRTLWSLPEGVAVKRHPKTTAIEGPRLEPERASAWLVVLLLFSLCLFEIDRRCFLGRASQEFAVLGPVLLAVILPCFLILAW
uniref:Uncharacterized protein n=1 Tax=Chromera velia CCMP2878 TaxID=1169474 RepID=A0A0G4GT55_9ALVE|eukprot:Cvel_23284.t1-p1 / transcript=Cvel_23284.t1 / gene=Cvel_23284 / organism=Chromera_velia_CCMP2878 / gene_product=hypothetical protein / transcript_product=hypothetical protein / location=Cvel_scaffold2383:8133-13996(+) / protein_length=990 / sequence_SO=supercontig / SO=protein_coding / is_pseudo=false